MIKKILLTIVLISTLFGFNYDKYLKSEIRTQIKMQKLVDDDGDYKEALNFGKLAYEIYNDNIFVISYYAKAMYLDGDLENSKNLFMKILSIEPSNDIASEFISKIEEQEAAQTNKDLDNTLKYLSDKGLDFLMIFLGFLGAEVLAKRYNDCERGNSKNTLDHYIYYKKNGIGLKNRISSIILDYFQTFFTICNVLSIIVLITISAAIAIVFNWLELMGYINIFLSNAELEIINSNALWIHFLLVLIMMVVTIVIFKFISALKNPPENINNVVTALQELSLNNEFEILQECIDDLIKENIQLEEILSLCVSEDAKITILNMYNISKLK